MLELFLFRYDCIAFNDIPLLEVIESFKSQSTFLSNFQFWHFFIFAFLWVSWFSFPFWVVFLFLFQVFNFQIVSNYSWESSNSKFELSRDLSTSNIQTSNWNWISYLLFDLEYLHDLSCSFYFYTSWWIVLNIIN